MSRLPDADRDCKLGSGQAGRSISWGCGQYARLNLMRESSSGFVFRHSFRKLNVAPP
mgnify:CR=1 FL=1